MVPRARVRQRVYHRGMGGTSSAGRRWLLLICAAGLALAGVGIAVARGVHVAKPLQRGTKPVRVTISGGCPSRLDGDGVTNPQPDHLDSVLAPIDPTRGLICRFAPLEGIQDPHVLHGALYRARILTRAEATKLAVVLDDLKPIPRGVFMCPSDSVRDEIIVFAYTDRPDVDLWYSAEGCSTVNNGYTIKGLYGSEGAQPGEIFSAYLDELAPLVRNYCGAHVRGPCPPKQ